MPEFLLLSYINLSVAASTADAVADDEDPTAVFIFVIVFVVLFLITLFRFRLLTAVGHPILDILEDTTEKKDDNELLNKIMVKDAPVIFGQEREDNQIKKRNKQQARGRPKRPRNQPDAYKGPEIVLSARSKQIEKALKRFVVPESQLRNIKHLASGGFADVFTCDWNGTQVAMKKMKPSLPPSELENFFVEMELMSKLRFPHLVGLIGCSFRPPYIIMPYLSRGTLHELLQDHRQELTWKHVRIFALHTAKALLYMHSMKPPITHRDIKSGNVLVDRDGTLKFTDFGLSKPEDPEPFTPPKTIVGTPQWTAPEIFKKMPYKRSADVYRFVPSISRCLIFFLFIAMPL